MAPMALMTLKVKRLELKEAKRKAGKARFCGSTTLAT